MSDNSYMNKRGGMSEKAVYKFVNLYTGEIIYVQKLDKFCRDHHLDREGVRKCEYLDVSAYPVYPKEDRWQIHLSYYSEYLKENQNVQPVRSSQCS